MQRIAIIARVLRRNQLDGIGWFTYNVFSQMVVYHPEIEFHFIYDREIDRDQIAGANVISHVVSFPPTRGSLLVLTWMEFGVNQLLNKINPALVIAPDGILPLRSKLNFLSVIHDVNYFHYPEEMKWSHRAFYQFFMPKYAKKARRIVTVSKFSKMDVALQMKIDESSIDVVYNGVNSHLTLPVENDLKNEFHKKLTEAKPFFLFVGTIIPRKNIPRLIKAFTLFKEKTRSQNHLVIAGSKYYGLPQVLAAVKESPFHEDIHIMGRVEDSDLRYLYSCALALIYPSLFEGFGIPIIEAQYFGLPVVCSRTSALPEIAGENAVLVDPLDIEAIANSMDAVPKNIGPSYKYDWQNSSKAFWDSISRVLDA